MGTTCSRFCQKAIDSGDSAISEIIPKEDSLSRKFFVVFVLAIGAALVAQIALLSVEYYQAASTPITIFRPEIQTQQHCGIRLCLNDYLTNAWSNTSFTIGAVFFTVQPGAYGYPQYAAEAAFCAMERSPFNYDLMVAPFKKRLKEFGVELPVRNSSGRCNYQTSSQTLSEKCVVLNLDNSFTFSKSTANTYTSQVYVFTLVNNTIPQVDSVLWLSLFDPQSVLTPGQDISKPLTAAQGLQLDLNSATAIGRGSMYAVSFSIQKTKKLGQSQFLPSYTTISTFLQSSDIIIQQAGLTPLLQLANRTGMNLQTTIFELTAGSDVVQTFEETPSYSVNDFISAIGGAFGIAGALFNFMFPSIRKWQRQWIIVEKFGKRLTARNLDEDEARERMKELQSDHERYKNGQLGSASERQLVAHTDDGSAQSPSQTTRTASAQSQRRATELTHDDPELAKANVELHELRATGS